jgi:hypothetical protein
MYLFKKMALKKNITYLQFHDSKIKITEKSEKNKFPIRKTFTQTKFDTFFGM